eukprot:PhM_4_TR8743/c0_g1_i2/m.45806
MFHHLYGDSASTEAFYAGDARRHNMEIRAAQKRTETEAEKEFAALAVDEQEAVLVLRREACERKRVEREEATSARALAVARKELHEVLRELVMASSDNFLDGDISSMHHSHHPHSNMFLLGASSNSLGSMISAGSAGTAAFSASGASAAAPGNRPRRAIRAPHRSNDETVIEQWITASFARTQRRVVSGEVRDLMHQELRERSVLQTVAFHITGVFPYFFPYDDRVELVLAMVRDSHENVLVDDVNTIVTFLSRESRGRDVLECREGVIRRDLIRFHPNPRRLLEQEKQRREKIRRRHSSRRSTQMRGGRDGALGEASENMFYCHWDWRFRGTGSGAPSSRHTSISLGGLGHQPSLMTSLDFNTDVADAQQAFRSLTEREEDAWIRRRKDAIERCAEQLRCSILRSEERATLKTSGASHHNFYANDRSTHEGDEMDNNDHNIDVSDFIIPKPSKFERRLRSKPMLARPPTQHQTRPTERPVCAFTSNTIGYPEPTKPALVGPPPRSHRRSPAAAFFERHTTDGHPHRNPLAYVEGHAWVGAAVSHCDKLRRERDDARFLFVSDGGAVRRTPPPQSQWRNGVMYVGDCQNNKDSSALSPAPPPPPRVDPHSEFSQIM